MLQSMGATLLGWGCVVARPSVHGAGQQGWKDTRGRVARVGRCMEQGYKGGEVHGTRLHGATLQGCGCVVVYPCMTWAMAAEGNGVALQGLGCVVACPACHGAGLQGRGGAWGRVVARGRV